MRAAWGVVLAAGAAACLIGAQAGPGSPEASTILATGGSSDSKADILWVMTKVKPARGPERTVLAMYQVESQGKGFALRGVRMLDADLRCIELQPPKPLSVQEVMKMLPKEEADALRPPPEKP